MFIREKLLNFVVRQSFQLAPPTSDVMFSLHHGFVAYLSINIA